MVLYVLDTSFKTVQVIDTFQSLIWTRRYSTTGDFELYTAANDDLLEVLRAGYYLVREEDVVVEGEYKNVMIISDVEVKSNAETGDALIVTGRDLKSILLRRVVSQQTVLSGTVENCITRLLSTTIISPSVDARRISNFRLGTNNLRTAYQMDLQVTGSVLEKVISDICATYGYGYDIYIKDGWFVFYLYEGADRSYSQDENTYVVFSGDFDNLISSDYKINRGNYSNVAYVAGEGEGTDRTIVSVGNAQGLSRYEQWVDARNASSNNGEISAADYKTMLAQEGSEKLSETVVTTKFEGEIDAFTNFVYGVDYFLGDVIQIKNDYGIAARTRIIEVIDSLDEGGREIVVTLSEMVENEVDTTEYLLTETRDVITTEADVGLKAEQSVPDVSRSSSATPLGYGIRISELPDPSSLDGDYYAALANPDVLTYRVRLPLKIGSGGDTTWNGRIITPSANGYYTDQYGNFYHRRNASTDVFNVFNYSGSSVFGVNFETGHVTNNELMTWAGTNITNGKANDTLAFWKEKGTCYCLFSQVNMVNGQPSQWGFLESIVYGSEVYQVWKAQPNGKMWHRGAHSSDTNMPNFASLDGVMSGTWTPRMGRANQTSSDGVWYQRGGMLLLRGRVVFSNSQTNQGGIYIDQGSLPSIARNVGLIGTGHVGGAMCLLSSNHYTNDNVFITVSGEASTNATSGYIKNATLRFVLVTMTTA